MEMKKYIELAEEKAGKQRDLAKMLEISDAYIRMVKSGKRSFSDDVCIQIADYIGADRLEVIAANNLVTEKDEKKRKIFESCFSTSKAASFLMAAIFIAVISIMTPPPANASQLTISDSDNLYYVK